MSIAAENVLGGIVMGGRDAYWRVADVVTAGDFANPAQANLFSLIAEMASGNADLDPVTIGDEAERRGIMEAWVVLDLASKTHSYANIRGHAEMVKAESMSRRFRMICSEGAKSGDMAETQAAISALLQDRPASVSSIKDVMKRMWSGVMDRYTHGDALCGLRTGFQDLDEYTGGLQPARVYGVGARAKMGKTVLAMNICANVACPPLDSEGNYQWDPKCVAIWSLEMSQDELAQRMAAAMAGVRSVLMQRPKMMDDDPESTRKLAAAIAELNKASLFVSDSMDVSVEDIEAQARQLRAEGKLDLLCVDHLGLMRFPKKERHDLSVAHVTRRLKLLAKELNIPVIIVFQLNRGSESGTVVRPPRPSDARDSGSIEQDLDVMLLLHRPSYYDKSARKGLRLDLALNRNGPTGLMELGDELDCCRFVSTGRPWKDDKGAGHSSYDDL